MLMWSQYVDPINRQSCVYWLISRGAKVSQVHSFWFAKRIPMANLDVLCRRAFVHKSITDFRFRLRWSWKTSFPYKTSTAFTESLTKIGSASFPITASNSRWEETDPKISWKQDETMIGNDDVQILAMESTHPFLESSVISERFEWIFQSRLHFLEEEDVWDRPRSCSENDHGSSNEQRIDPWKLRSSEV